MQIKTNNRSYPILYWSDLSLKEKKEFDYLKDPEENGYMFFRYKKQVYSIESFLACTHEEFKGWNGYHSDSFFSGILIKFNDDEVSLKVAIYYS